VEDTIGELQHLGIATTGAGMNLADARRPVLIERQGLRFGFLSYNCVGPRESWAGTFRPGCAYVHVLTHYEPDYASPGGPPTVYTFADPKMLEAMAADIQALRTSVDVLTVALHKGLGHTPATVGMYERQIARSAIDAGADVVVGHHAHILQGMEIYRNRPIFHGLGNFAIATRALTVDGNSSPKRLAWAERRRKLFGFEPDPEYVTYPFHPEAKNAIIAFCEVNSQGIHSAGFIPCFVNKHSQPEVLGDDDRGRVVAEYVRDITARAGLNALFEWVGDRVLFYRRKL
jgi:poly-gamma-glutamate capsule biosynthesis protein CapA/YwtB (metallophosphatase superfamily)